MTRPTRLEVCCGGCEPKCGKCGIPVEIELTDAEVAQLEADRLVAEQERAEREAIEAAAAEAKASAQSKLAALGLTPEEISALTK
jgi:hypothetical protein